MTDDRSAEKPTDQWVTGDEPMTGPQASYLQTLAREAGEDVPEGLTKAQASELIDRLRTATGRTDDGDAADPAGTGPSDGDAHGLAERIESEGIVDQQGVLLDEMQQSGETDARGTS